MPINPTSDTYQTLNKAYDYFNLVLFEGKLPGCLITMQRKGRSLGYFCPERFQTRKENEHYVHEIALNPAHFISRSDEDILSTLVHEMAHLWQQEKGTAPNRPYHNREWSEKMEDLGLIPSNTGEEGGRKTGQSMSHYIDESGRFAGYVKSFLEENQAISYQDRPILKANKAKSKNKIKYTCPKCSLNAWGKPNANLICGDDSEQMVAVS